MKPNLDPGYDVIVLGDSIGALVAATTAANDRARTLWIPHERRTWSVHSGGYNFPVEEGLVTGMAPGGAFTLLCEGTGLHPSEALKFTAVNPALQVITPNMRLSLPSGRDDLRHELVLECGAEAAKEAEVYLERADALRLQVDTWISHLVRASDEDIPPPPTKQAGQAPPGLEHAVAALLASVTNAVDADVLEPFERARAIGVFRAGIFSAHDDPSAEDDALATKRKRVSSGAALAIRHLLAARARHTPMTILRGSRVRSVRTRWGTVRGVLLDDDTRVDAKVVITALDDDDGVRVDGFVARRRGGIRTSAVARTYTVHLIVARDVFPIGLGSRAVLVNDPSQPLLGDNLVLASREHADDDHERLALSARVPLGASPQDRAIILGKCIDRFRTIAPFLDRGIKGVFPPIGSPHDLQPDSKQTDPWTIVRGPLATSERPPGEFPAGRFTTPVKNLLRAGSATLPGLGYEGELLSGVAAGRRALRIINRN